MTMYDLVRQFKGVTVWEFSQAKGDIYPRIGKDGICDALSACWINYHAHNDSLANHLRQSGLDNREVMTLNHMIFLHDSLKNRVGASAVTTWLGMHGMISLTSNGNTSDYPDIEYRIVTTLAKSYGCYAFIAFGVKDFVIKRTSGHAVAVWLGGSDYIKGDACFFEPNYGEFWFASKQDFFSFFPMYFQQQRERHGIREFLPQDKKAESWLVSTFALSNRAL